MGDRNRPMSDEDKLALIEDLNNDGKVEDMTDMTDMIRRACNAYSYADGDALRAEYLGDEIVID